MLRSETSVYSKIGATRLAETIAQYWIEHGYRTVRAWTFRIGDGSDWGMRSNLVNGLPPNPFAGLRC